MDRTSCAYCTYILMLFIVATYFNAEIKLFARRLPEFIQLKFNNSRTFLVKMLQILQIPRLDMINHLSSISI